MRYKAEGTTAKTAEKKKKISAPLGTPTNEQAISCQTCCIKDFATASALAISR